MHAHTAPFVTLFDALFSANETKFADNQTFIHRNPSSQKTLRRNGENLLSMAKAHERLSLLVHLELPCTILIATPYQHLRHTVIKAVDLGGESLAIYGEGFNLHLCGQNFHTIRLVNHRDKENGETSLDIHDSMGLLYASIQPVSDGTGTAVWRDVMDNPSLTLA